MENNWVEANCVDDAVENKSMQPLILGNSYFIKEAQDWQRFAKEKHFIVRGLEIAPDGAENYYHHSHFAPIISYPDHTSKIAQQFKEHPDTVDQPVKVLETVN